MKRITINPFKLFRSVICLTMLVLTIIYAGNFITGGVQASSDEVEYVTVVVHSGDTLWSIAKNNTKGDVRDKVDEIISFNNLDSSRVELHQRIKVPVER